jgi:hypothetical protein
MTISSGDIKLIKSQVMLDAAEGGGAPTATEVPDGVSNAIFPDVSDTDRSLGRVNLRKVFVHVATPTTDDFLGANVIVAEPANDPNVAITLFSTGEAFDRRASAVSRIEAYLSIGPQYQGYLFGNHIQGQRTLLIYQKTDTLPAIGATLVLTKREGASDQYQQYVRVTEASGVMQTFEDDKGTYQRFVMTLKLSSALLVDFPGFDVSRYEYSKTQLALATKLSDTIVADAARYYGVSPLEVEGGIGDYTIKAASMFTQLVPSAQIETPILEARTNQLQGAVIASGGPLVRNGLVMPLDTANRLFLGGAVEPGSLLIVRNNGSWSPITDDRGRLMIDGAEVGQIDYDNGLATVTTSIGVPVGSPWTLDITYKPAATPQAVTQSQGFEITIVNRSLSYVRTIEPAPVRGSMSVSYMAQGRWYTLRDGGDGALRGSTPQQGAGTINFTTGTVLVTLGALPDVGSALIYTWAEPQAARDATLLTLDNNGKLYWPFNTSGESSLEAGAKVIAPGALTITWLDGVTTRTVTDDGAGNLTGYGSGTVNYGKGTFRLSPTTLPAPGTAINVTVDTAAKTDATVAIASGAGDFGVTNITPGSVSFDITGQLRGQYMGGPIVNWGAPATFRVTDDGAGALKLYIANTTVTVGAINYAAGTFVLSANTILPTLVAALAVMFDNIYLADTNGLNMFDQTA